MLRVSQASTGRPRHPASRWFATLTALALGVSGLSLAVPPANAGTDDVRVTLPGAMAENAVVAASGQSMLLASNGTDPDRVTRDSGTNIHAWAPSVPENAVIAHVGHGRVVWTVDTDAASTAIYISDFTNGTPTKVNVAGQVETTDASTAIFYAETVPEEAGYYAQDLATGDVHKLAYTPDSTDASAETTFHTDDGALALVSTTTTDADGLTADGYLDLLPVNGDASPVAAETVPGLIAAALRGDEVVYVTAAQDSFTICFRTVSDWATPSCQTFSVSGIDDPRTATADLALGADWALVTPHWGAGAEANLVVAGTTASTPGVPVTVPPVGDRSRVYAVGDSERPLISVWEGTTGYVGQVRADGSVRTLFNHATTPADMASLHLTTDRLTGLDSRPSAEVEDYQAWERAVTQEGAETGIDRERLLSPRAAAIGTSAGRTLLDDGTQLRLSEQGYAVRTLAPPKYGVRADSLSGPYFVGRTVAYDQVVRVDGVDQRRYAQVRALFGSLALIVSNASLSLNNYEVADVTSPSSTRVTVPQRYHPIDFDALGLWGDYVLGFTLIGTAQAPTAVVLNYRTNQAWDHVGYPIAIGDGFVVVEVPAGDAADPNDDELGVWNFATDKVTIMPDLDWREVATDGNNRLAYNTDSQLVLRDLAGAGTSAPRLLGTVAPDSLNLTTAVRSWTLELDVTKPLTPGSLTIQNAGGGGIVRSMPVDVSPDGSVRGIAWDGRDAAGNDVAAGTYTWVLRQAAADGTGELTRTDGSAGVTGAIQVIRQPLGTVTGATPKITDKTPGVGQTLSVSLGAWSPTAGLGFSYQWYRSKSSAVIGTGATYQVTRADLGRKLRVQVTGSVPDWTSTMTASGYTSKVHKGRLSPTPAPTIDNRKPLVGQVLTASAAWGPSGVKTTFQWYRVSASGKSRALRGETAATYMVRPGVAGSKLKVKVTGRLSGCYTAHRYSRKTAKVART